MKKTLLVMSTLKRRPLVDGLFEGLEREFHLRYEKVVVEDRVSLSELSQKFNFLKYDLVLFDLPHRYMRKQSKYLGSIGKKVVIYEEDACQNFISDSLWFRDFSHFYKQIPEALIINTGFLVAKKLREEGVNAHFLPKGYDPAIISNLKLTRPVDLGFIGTYGSNAYCQRYKYLRFMERRAKLAMIRTNLGKEYNDTLNRIRVFFSADAGIGEYMAKNFEAMAAGCILMAYRQGEPEEGALGLVDGENVVLYSSEREALNKLQELLLQPDKMNLIASNGTKHAERFFSFDVLSERLAQIILSK